VGRTALLSTYSGVEVVEAVTADSANFLLAMGNGLTFIRSKRPSLSGSALFLCLVGWETIRASRATARVLGAALFTVK
jgi:hypothetical protein